MKHSVIALKIHNGEVSFENHKTKINLPDGCIGLFFAFESKKKAREWWGNDVNLVRIEERETNVDIKT